MPPISPERWSALSPHLDQALDLPRAERASWLERLRDRDPSLAAEVSRLLGRYDTLDREGFLSDESAPAPRKATLAGVEVGAYTLRSPLGQGGMGQVWLAERSDGRFEGTAAVKLLNVSLIGRDGEARFRREGSLLARLRHPFIAHLIDAGMLSTGQPYLILEHVDGEPIDAYCDAHRLPVARRLRLFLDVLTAVAFAHANLVVHRDLKPANILVGRDDRVRLLDFGIAKLLEPEGTAEPGAGVTRDGESAATPEYAAPEQLTGGAITTATDVYALGVVLYLLLTGRHPVGPGPASPAALVRAVLDQDPKRPSDAVISAQGPSEEERERIAAGRGVTVNRLQRILAGNLDNIVGRALKKDPRERYPSVESFADDLRRHLNDEPVSARPDSIVRRLTRFVRRHRAATAAAALTLAAIVAGSAGVAWQAREADRQREYAESQLERAAAANDFLSNLLSIAAPPGSQFTVSQLLDAGEALVDQQFSDDDALRAEMLVVIGWQQEQSEEYERARPILERAAALAGKSSDPALRARALCPLAFLKMMQGEADAGRAMIAGALAALPEAPQYDLQRAECLVRRADFGFWDGDGGAMMRDSRAAMTLLDRARGATRARKTDALASLAYGCYLARRNAEAEALYPRLVAELEATGRGRTVAAADAYNNWALIYFQGDLSKAEPLLRKDLELRRAIEGAGPIAPTHPFNLAGLLADLGRYDEAEPLLEEVIRTAEARGKHRIQFDAMMRLADTYTERGDLARAEAQLDRLKPWESHPEYTPFRTAQMAYYRGRVAEARGDAPTARDRYARAVEMFESRQAKIAMNVRALVGLARAERLLGDLPSATATAGRALDLAQSFVAEGSPSYLIGYALVARGENLDALGKQGEALEAFRDAADHLSRTLGADHPAAKDARRRAEG